MSHLPRQVQVAALVKGRYESFPFGGRPASWDLRKDGIDTIKTTEGEKLALASDGQQSSPGAGWTLLLTEDTSKGYRWTLYGMPKGSRI